MQNKRISVDPEITQFFKEKMVVNEDGYPGFTMVVREGSLRIDKKFDMRSADPFKDLVAEFGDGEAKFAVFDVRGKLEDGTVGGKAVLVSWMGPNAPTSEQFPLISMRDEAKKALPGISSFCHGFNDTSRPWILDALRFNFIEFCGKKVEKDATTGKYKYV